MKTKRATVGMAVGGLIGTSKNALTSQLDGESFASEHLPEMLFRQSQQLPCRFAPAVIRQHGRAALLSPLPCCRGGRMRRRRAKRLNLAAFEPLSATRQGTK